MTNTQLLVPVLVPDLDKTLAEFCDYCVLSERLTERVSKDYQHIIRTYLKFANGVVSRKTVKGYLSTYLRKAPKTYNNQLDGLRAFIERYLKRFDIMQGFKKAYVPGHEPESPTKQQVRKGFYGLTYDLERSLYLLYATAGLRKNEALGLRNGDINRKLRCVRANHDTRTKKSGITFYNEECKGYLQKYQNYRNDSDERVFVIGSKRFRDIWDKASKAAGFRITPQALRIWHATELGELGVPDRYVDVFQGRAPKSVLAKFYTGKDLLRLKRIYDKAGLRVLSQPLFFALNHCAHEQSRPQNSRFHEVLALMHSTVLVLPHPNHTCLIPTSFFGWKWINNSKTANSI